MFKVNRRNSRFIEIYSDYYSLIFGAVAYRVSSIDDAEDIAQEIFLRFFRKMDEVEDPRKWLMGTMRLVLFEYYKKNNREFIDIDEVYNDAGLAFVNGMRETRMIIRDVIESSGIFKDDRDRLIFDHIAIQRYSIEETGRVLGLTRDQVRYRYSNIARAIILALKTRGITKLEELFS